MIQQLNEVNEQVFQRDRGGTRTHPARRSQHRQVIDHVAHHLEGGGAGTDDNSGPQLGYRHTRLAQEIAGDLTSAQMVGLLLRWCLQRAEKDNLTHRRLAQGIANMRRHPTLMGDKIAAFAHAMYQIVKRIDTGEQRRQSLRLIEID